MYLINETYFSNEINIPNLNEMDSDTLLSLNIAIDRYVRLFLQNALGYTLFTELDSYVIDGVLDAGAPQKWLDLVNGKDEWKGLKFEEGSYKGSMMAKFVFYFWLKDYVSLVTGTGEKTITATDTVGVNSTQRLVNIWNDFVKDNQGYYNPCHHFVSFDCYWTGLSTQPNTLLGFLTKNEIDYPEAKKTIYKIQNQLGL